jgi:hypothetical protein
MAYGSIIIIMMIIIKINIIKVGVEFIFLWLVRLMVVSFNFINIITFNEYISNIAFASSLLC